MVHGGFLLGMWAVNALYYPYTSDVLGRGPETMGLFTSAYFGASLVAGILMERWGQRLKGNRQLLAGYAVGTVVWVGSTLISSVGWAVALNVLDGTVYTLATTLFQTRVQEEAPAEQLGRIFAVFYAYEEITTAVGMVLGGWIATSWGILTGLCAALFAFMTVGVAFALDSCRSGEACRPGSRWQRADSGN